MKPVALIPILACLLLAGAAAAVEVPTTYGDAMRWYRKAAEEGSAKAQFFLGRMYETGQFRDHNPVLAARWYQKAAAQGHRLAQYRLGQMYLSGRGVKQAPDTAAEWFEKAGRQDLKEAQFNLGYLYDSGLGVKKSPQLAAEWYRKAAEQGVGKAQYNLGVLLSGQGRGGGEATDKVEAWMWLALAAEGGVNDAAAARDGVEKRMSAAEKAEARGRLDARKGRKPAENPR